MPNEKQETKEKKKGKFKQLVNSLFGEQKGKPAPLSEETGKIPKPKRKLTPQQQEMLNQQLLQAVKRNDLEKVKTCLNFGGDPNYKYKGVGFVVPTAPTVPKEMEEDKIQLFTDTSELSSPFIIASAFGYTEIVDELIKHGADVNLRDKDGKTALIWAAKNGCMDTRKLLVENGADMNLQDEYGLTALVWAVRNGYTRTSKFLIDHGADVNIQSKNGWTALMNAAMKGQTATVKYLLSAGANPLLKYKNGQTAFHQASDFWKEIKLMLKEYMKKWELIGEENILLIQHSVRNCEPFQVEGIFKSL